MVRKTVCNILAPGVNPNLVLHVAGDILLTFFTHGNVTLLADENLDISNAVQKYISDTRQFVY